MPKTTKEEIKKDEVRSEDKPQDPIKLDPTKEETIAVPKSLLETLQNDIAALKKNEELLMQVADKKQLALYYSRNKKDLPPIVKLRMLNNKVILGWRTIQDDVFEDSVTGRWKEIQVIEIIYEDGEKEKIALRDYGRRYVHISAKVLETRKKNDGEVILKVERKDNGKVYEVGVQYVN